MVSINNNIINKIGYKFLSQELTRFRMKTVDENRSIRAIEEKVASGMIEELIYAAHNELKLLRIMKKWKPWEHLFGEQQEKEELLNMVNFRSDHPFATSTEHYDAMRHNRPARKPSAGLHPEEQKE